VRLKAALIIIVIVLIITTVEFGSSLILTRNTLNVTINEDITSAGSFTNDSISERIRVYEADIRTADGSHSEMEAFEFLETAIQELLSEFAGLTAASVSESITEKLRNRFILLALISAAAGVIAAVVSSGFIAKPYNKVAEQKRRLEELYEINRLQTEKIKEAHNRTKLMMDAMPICSTLWNRKGIIFDCNEEAVKTFGMKNKQDFLDRFFCLSPEYQINGESSRDLAISLIEKTLKEGRTCVEWMHQLQNGTPVPCEIISVRVNNGNDYFIAAYARDLREQKQMMEETQRLQTELKAALKEAQEASRAKTDFLANMSHEMRTPLNAIVGLSELILNAGEPPQQAAIEPQARQQPIPDEIEDKLGKIHSSGMTLLNIVNDILDISKIESGKFELHPIKYDTASLINDIVSQNIVRIGEKPIQFILTVDDNIPEQLFGDDLRIRQIFSNILTNAFKYTNIGTVEWKVMFEREGDNIELISDIKDTGMGIRSKDIDKLFEDYSQVDAQANRKVESTGLGLSITKRLVGMMDGTISVKSIYGIGSVFSIRLRQRIISDHPIGKITAWNLLNARYADNKRIQNAKLVKINLSYACVLVVDDMQTNLDVAKGMLKSYGLRVDCASSGRQAIDMIRACSDKEDKRYDAVFMDHMMPDMDGIETVRIIREELGTDYARNVPVIALTANAIAGNESMFLKHGFQAFISKPIDTLRLDSILRKWVRNKDREEKLSDNTGPDGKNDSLNINTEQNIDKPDSGTAACGIMITGVDTAAGLKRFDGNEEEYIKILRSYTVNTRPLLEIMNEHLKKDNPADYAVIVHGIKGSSFGIGAAHLGAQAERMERLAKTGGKDQVIADNGTFIESIKNLLDSIDSALTEYNSKNIKPVLTTPDPELLRELREACKDYDAGKVNRIMKQLEFFYYENGTELVTWLQKQVEDMNFIEISSGIWPE